MSRALTRLTRITVTVGVLPVVLSASMLAAAGPAAADPPANGCPVGFEAKTVQQWAALGYAHMPAYVDDQANGGNGDHIACGRALGEGTERSGPDGQVLYEFRDNNLPASS